MKLMTYTTRVQDIGIQTDQFSATMDFYAKLGFVLKLETTHPVTGGYVAFLSSNGVIMEIYQVSGSAMCYGAIDHIAFDVTDIEDAYRIAVSHGFTILESEIQFLPFWENGVRFFTLEGPNQEKIEFNQMS